ncbi:type II secretion system F family protein [bacterium]|nr:type II secretion system F family protein [bacterium]
MPRYSYTATSQTGEIEKGVSEAANEHELAKILREKGYILISATEQKAKKKIELSFSFRRVSLKEKLFFTRNFALMVRTGVPLPRALAVLASQTKNNRFKRALLDIREEVIRGKALSESMKRWPDIFPEIFWNMVKIGEESGNLEQVLENLSYQMERTYELKERVKGALIYPAVIIIAMVGIGILMLIMVVPKLSQTFNELGIELPFTTRLVIYSANFITKFWYLFLVIVIGILFLIKRILKTKKGSKFFDGLVLKIPIVSSIVKGTNTAYTARTLSALINSGVPIVKSLEIISHALGNWYFKKAISESAQKVKKGTKLSETLRSYSDIFPYSFAEMIAVGEETGETSDILEDLADFAESEVENLTKNLSSAIEPVIMIIIGAAVGFFAVSMIQPIYSMLQTL